MSTRKTTLFYAVLLAIASLAVGMVIASRLDLTPTSSAQMVSMPAMNSTPLGGPIDSTTFRTIAKQQIPTVVNIRTESRQRTQDLTEFFGGQGGDDLLRRFFGGPGQGQGPDSPQQRNPRRRPQSPQGQLSEGAGTGFVIDRGGFILTNNHVIEGADKITVAFVGASRNEEYPAKVIGRDALTDSALLQLTEMPSTPLQEAKFGDSSQMQQGDWVMAIGNPFALGHTVTVGVISALDRPFGGTATRQQPMLQTDAAINPGNSGGPLLNIRGEVVGMNTAIYTDAQRAANIGIGFATPINTIRELLPQLRAGKISRGVIGVAEDDHVARLRFANRRESVVHQLVPRHADVDLRTVDHLVHEEEVADLKRFLHAARGDPKGLDDESANDDREHHGQHQRFQILAEGRFAPGAHAGRRRGGFGHARASRTARPP